MITVYKYEIPFSDYVHLPLPLGAEILYAGNQKENLCLWAKVDTDITTEKIHKIRVAGTGHPLVDGNDRYIGSPIFAQGNLVFHIFELEV